MKYDRAWTIKVDAPVYAKSVETMVNETVERTLDSLIKETFVDTLKSEKAEDPVEIKQEIKQTDNILIQAAETSKQYFKSDIQPFWIALGIMSLIFFVAINNLYYKISTLESWLHGRMLS